MNKTAIILGATGLTGGLLLEKLLEDERYQKIKLFSRTSIGKTHPKIEEHLIDLMELEKYADLFSADEVFCCVGTTASKTPDKETYKKIDYGIPVAAAKLSKTNTINTFIVVSALGADSNSRVFYNRIKGQMETAVLAQQIKKTHILQPSLISGHRNERRLGEWIGKQAMKLLNTIMIGSLKKYRSIHPEKIVTTMVWLANADFKEIRIESDHIQRIADYS